MRTLCYPQSSINAFTLTELLISLALCAIVASFTIPSYHIMAQKYHAACAIAQLHRAVNFARSQAIYRHTMIRLSPLGTWSKGYQVSDNGTPIETFEGPTHGYIVWKSFPAYAYLQLTPEGFTYYQNGTFYYTSKDDAIERRLIVNQAGRAREA